MESILRATPSYEQLIKELDDLKRKVFILETDNYPGENKLSQSYKDNSLFKVLSNKYSENNEVSENIQKSPEEAELLKIREKYLAE
jgi:hemerythrin-like domain-containing protein